MAVTSGMVLIAKDAEEILGDLTHLQRRFVEQMLVSPNAASAYRRAGGTAKTEGTVRSGAWELLTNPNVQRALQELREKRRIRVLIEQDWVLEKLLDVVERCMQEVPVFGADGEPTGEYRFDSAGANKALDLLMKHLGMFERDNFQKATAGDLESIRARLQQRGIDAGKTKALPGET